MAISFVGAAWATTSSVTLPTHQAGDLIIIFAARPAGSVDLLAGWTPIYDWNGGPYGEVVIAYKFATAPGTASGTWNYATRVGAAIYRGANGATPIGVLASSENYNSSSGYFPPLDGMQPQDSWVVAASFAETTHPGNPGGLTVRTASNPGRLYDSNGVRTSWSGVVYSLGATRDVISVVFEIRGGEQKSTAGAVSLAIGTPGTPTKAAPVVSAGQDAWQPVPIPNGTFETDLSGWTGTFFGSTLSAITRDTTVKRTGTASMKIEARRDLVGSDGVFDTGTAISNANAASINRGRYRLSAWVYADASCDEFGFGAWFDSSIPWVTTTTKGTWVNLVTEGEQAADRPYITLAFDVKGTNAVGWVDDITIEYLAVGNPLDLTVAGEVVKAQGEVKPVTSDVTLETLLVSGFTGATLFANSGLMLDLGAAGVMAKAADIAGATSLGVSPAGVPSKHVNRAGAVGLNLNPTGSVSRGEENLGGLITRIAAYAPNGARLGPLPGWQGWNVTVPYGSDSGAFDGTYPLLAPQSEVLASPVEVALEIFDGKKFVEPLDCRWLLLNQDTDEIDPAANRSLTGVSMGFRLTKTYVADGATDGWTIGERRFTSSTAGRIMATFCAEAKARGALAGIDVSTFSATTDSAGNSWSLINSMGFSVGVALSSVVEALVQQGMMEVRWQGRTLLLYDTETSSADRTLEASPVVLMGGRDLTNAPVTATMTDVATVALVRGDGGISVEVTNASAVSPWGRWETTLDQGGAGDLDALETMGAASLERVAVGREQHTHALNFVSAQKFPLLHYKPGDWLYSLPSGSASKERYRLQQVTLSMGTDGLVTGSATLNDRLVEQDVKTKRRLDGIQGGATNAGPRPRESQTDNTTPKPPTNLAATTLVYQDEKAKRAQVSLTFLDPTQNTDNTPITDLNMVQVWAKPSRAGTTWRFLTAVPAGSQAVTYSPLEVSEQYSFRLTAIDFTGHTSDYSNTVTLNMASDVLAPPTPAAPTVNARNGVVEIYFSGQANDGSMMPIDFSHVEVYAHTSSSFSATSTYRRGTIAAGASSLTLTNWAYGAAVYARIIAVDVSGNKSAVSPVSAGATNDKVDSGDIANDAVGPGQVDVPGLDSGGNLNVRQLDGETINGVYINGGVFVSTNTSQRVEVGNTGDGDPTDEVRMFNAGTVVSLRNPSDRPGYGRLNCDGRIFDFGTSVDGNYHGSVRVTGRGTWKWVSDGFQARNNSDTGYMQLQASAFLVSSKEEFKKNIRPAAIDPRAALEATSARRYQYKWDDDPGNPNQGEQLGLMAEELPDEVRAGDGYSVTAVVALLWDALREANERIEKLEKRREVP